MKHKIKEESNKNTNEDGVNQDYQDPHVSPSCSHCNNHPCVREDLQPTLISILQTYRECKTNKQVRFTMYREATKFIH